MMRLVLASLLVLALPLHNRLVEAGAASHQHSGEAKTSHDMLKKTPTNNPHNMDYPCDLLNAVEYYCTCGCTAAANGGSSGGLSSGDQTACQAWISQVEVTLEACNGQINDTVVVEVADSLQVLFDENENIAEQLSWLSVNDSTTGAYWGCLKDFIKVRVELQFSIVESSSVITLEASGSCLLSDSIMAAAQASGNATIIARCQQLVASIDVMLEGSYNVTEQLAFIAEICEQQYPDLVVFLKAKVQIQGFGSFASLLDVCDVNDRVEKMHDYMAGKDADDSPFLKDFKKAFLATCVSGQANFSQCTQLGNLYAQINATFAASVDIEVRMEAVANYIFQFSLSFPWICSIELDGCGCSLYDIMFCSSFCHNEGACAWEQEPPTLPPASTTAGTTTKASTAAPTTVSMCAERSQIIAVSSSNTSCIITSLIVAMGKMSASERQSFNPCLTSMENVVYNKGNAYASVNAQIDAIINITVHFQANTSLNTMLLNINIYFSDNVTLWGNFNSFCTCGNV